MPKIRNPKVVSFIKSCHRNDYTAKDAYIVYENQNKDTIKENRIELDGISMSESAFKNLFYQIKKEINRDLSMQTSITAEVIGENAEVTNGENLLTLPDDVKSDESFKDSKSYNDFSILLQHPDESLYSAYTELVSFYDQYHLTSLVEKSIKLGPLRPDFIDAPLLRWYVRLKQLSSSADSLLLNLSETTRNRLRQLRVLGAEKLAWWETNHAKMGVTMTRPKVEDIFLTEFWLYDDEKFEDLVMKGYKGNCLSGFREQWTFYDLKTRNDLAIVNPYTSILIDHDTHKKENEYLKKVKEEYDELMNLKNSASDQATIDWVENKINELYEQIKHPYYDSEEQNKKMKLRFNRGNIDDSDLSSKWVIGIYPGDHIEIDHENVTRVRFPGEIEYLPTSDPLEFGFSLKSEFLDIFKIQRYPLSLLQLHLFDKYSRFREKFITLSSERLKDYTNRLISGEFKTFQADNEYLNIFKEDRIKNNENTN